MGTLVNFRLWGNIWLAVRLSAMPLATSAPLAMVVAPIALPHQLQVIQGVNPLDGLCIHRIKGILNDCI